jgi:hypothetical protein
MDDEISQGPEREFRLPPKGRRFLIAAGLAGLVAACAVFAVTRGGAHHASANGAATVPALTVTVTPHPMLSIRNVLPDNSSAVGSGGLFVFMPDTPVPVTPIAPAPVVAAPGTVLVTCDTAFVGAPDPGWRAGSLRVGSLWLVGARQSGYARLGRARQPGRAAATNSAPPRPSLMLVYVDAGSAVVMKPAAGSRSYFQFSDDPGGGSHQLLGDKGFTLVPCSATAPGGGRLTEIYYLGYSIASGHTASVEVLTSPSARPVWLTFTAQK